MATPSCSETTTSQFQKEAWQAVQSRDNRYDGHLLYAVLTTGIYCRPSCPSRRPKRANVLFFQTPAQAEHKGFRPCLRCRPTDTHAPTEKIVRQIRTYIDTHLHDPLTLAHLATEAGCSPYYLQRIFKRSVGLSPHAYQNAHRLETFKQQVKKGKTVLEATYESGFGSSHSLYNQANSGLGMSPGTYRRGGRGLHIRYTITSAATHRILVATTKHGVCAVCLGNQDDALETELKNEFPNATFTLENRALHEWVQPVVQYLEGTCMDLSVPLDLQGSDFQRLVWQALQEIPVGETRTYAQIASAVNRPTAWRAVARACASNKTALVVPCHRVVRKDGTPGCYRWGADRKKQLLELEQDEQFGK